jgi:hypothetical protein
MKKVSTKAGAPRYKVYWYDPSGIQRSKTFIKSEDGRRLTRASTSTLPSPRSRFASSGPGSSKPPRTSGHRR